jgi:hypothetical protein
MRPTPGRWRPGGTSRCWRGAFSPTGLDTKAFIGVSWRGRHDEALRDANRGAVISVCRGCAATLISSREPWGVNPRRAGRWRRAPGGVAAGRPWSGGGELGSRARHEILETNLPGIGSEAGIEEDSRPDLDVDGAPEEERLLQLAVAGGAEGR